MKKIFIILTFATLFRTIAISQNNTFPGTGSAGIGTTMPAASALLDMVSTSKGFLVSRMTQVQRNAIVAPATGLMIYQTNGTKGFYFYNGSAWKELSPSLSGWALTGNSATNATGNFIGTTDLQPLVFRVNNEKAGIIEKASAITALGYHSLYSNTGSYNTANGYLALQSNTNGYYNTASGAIALSANSTGSNNTANGFYSLGSNIDGTSNTAIGAYSLYYNESGQLNTACGLQALYQNTVGNYNTACGVSALYYNEGGSSNTAIGNGSLGSNYYGSYNSAMGAGALGTNVFGSYNTAVGYSADVASDNLNNATAIGNGAIVDASNKVRIGNSSITSIGGHVGWSTFSDARVKKNIKQNVPGLAFIKLLKPVTFNADLSKEYELLGKFDSSVYKEKNDIEKINFTGFIAQDVQAAAQKIGYDFSGVDNTGKIMGLRYSEFVVPLVKAVQELAEDNDRQIFINDSINTNLQNQLNIQQKQIADLKVLIAANQNSVMGKNSEARAVQSLFSISIAPNPAQNSAILRMTGNTNKVSIIIRDISGKTLWQQQNIVSNQINLPVQNLAAGIYMVTVNDGENKQVVKLVKE